MVPLFFPAIWTLITSSNSCSNLPRTVLGSVWNEFGFFGLDLGKVLAGIQAPEQDSAQFDEFLHELGYPYVEETHNEVYRRYLRK